MDEGWTRLVLDNHQIKYSSVSSEDFRQNRLNYDCDNSSAVMNHNNERAECQSLSAEFAGGIGETGAESLKRFVEKA